MLGRGWCLQEPGTLAGVFLAGTLAGGFWRVRCSRGPQQGCTQARQTVGALLSGPWGLTPGGDPVAGDSRCVLARRNSSGAAEPVQLTWDAKPDHPEELKRIQQSGLLRVDKGLDTLGGGLSS